MIGRIKSLSNRSGFIYAENGQTVYFTNAAVWEHDFPFLTIGQPVSFELQPGDWPRASNVHLFERHAPHVPEKAPGPVQLRYVGFDQANSVRTFRFQAVVSGEQTRDYVVKADVKLFQKYRVGIQEGPALCGSIVHAELTAGK